MLPEYPQTFLNWLKSWFNVSSNLPRHRDRPPSRLGCINVEIFAEPKTDSDARFLRMVERLKRAQGDGALPNGLLEYFSDRYRRLGIGRTVGCPLDVYLKRPMVVEQIHDDLTRSSQNDPHHHGTDR